MPFDQGNRVSYQHSLRDDHIIKPLSVYVVVESALGSSKPLTLPCW
jgi:hypothetical protein